MDRINTRIKNCFDKKVFICDDPVAFRTKSYPTMKRFYRYYGLLIFVFTGLLSPNAMSQDLPFLNSFSLAEINGKVYLQWIIASGNTCDGVRVYRSADAENFEQIGQIAGICGSPFSAVSYDFWDTLPLLNTTSYYRLELGNLGFSAIQSVQLFDFNAKNYQIIPHPATAESVIYFENEAFELFTLRIFNSSGQQLYAAQTKANEFSLQPAKLGSGIYGFTIINAAGNIVIQGKVVVG